MTKFYDYSQLTMVVGGTFITGLLGGWDASLKLLILLIVVDMITGTVKAIANKQYSSSKAGRGFSKKIGYLVIVILAHQFDSMMPQEAPVIRTIAIFFYIWVESSSIIENLAILGVPIPKAIVDVLEQVKKKGGGGAGDVNIPAEKDTTKVIGK